MSADVFTVLADPTRRGILDRLRATDSTVSGLVEALAASQPQVSKHLRVLRDAGFVTCRAAAQHRVYRVEPERFAEVAAWLEPYRELWSRHLDALERHLDQQEDQRS